LKRFTVLLAPRLVDDVEKHLTRLRGLAERNKIALDCPDAWYAMFEEALTGLRTLAERHQYAPERKAWGRDVRNALFAEYRILYLVAGDDVWAMRVRHQRQAQLRRLVTGTTYPPSL
jgi:plasmid stabilization system protein ParE